MNDRTASSRALHGERWSDVELVQVCEECDVAAPTTCKLRPYFDRQPAHAWCRHFAERCETDCTFTQWRDGSGYCRSDACAIDNANRAFAQHTRETNEWFRRYLTRMIAERPRAGQRLLDAERARSNEHTHSDPHPYPST
jgi:hypothetical protein